MIKEILESLDKSKKNYAIFDCDETIISGDIEESVSAYQIETGNIKVRLEELRAFVNDDSINFDENFRKKACQIYREKGISASSYILKGYTPNEVYDMAVEAKKRVKVRPKILELFKLLRENDVEIYICSASTYYTVIAIADECGIPRENVLATKHFLTEDGKLTGEESVAVRSKAKVEAIKSLDYPYSPILIAGDSDGDYYMFTRFKPLHGMIINPKENTKVNQLIDNVTYFKYLLD